ncbi:MAG: 3'-5' exonuclease [Solirubrobacteraceae bacterium]
MLKHAVGLHGLERDTANNRRIAVSTIHSAKGTESRLVVLLGCEEQLLPSWRPVSLPTASGSPRSAGCFYVAATRAKDRLLITHVAERGRRPTGGPSRFLAEAGLCETDRSLAV